MSTIDCCKAVLWTVLCAACVAPALGQSGAVHPRVGEDGTVLTPPWSARTRYRGPGLQGTGAPHVAIVASAAGDVLDPPFTDPQAKLMATGLFGSVTVINAAFETPALADLLEYDALLVWSNFDFAGSEALGDVLADYVDDPSGGGVVLAVFATTSDVPGRFLEGRWRADGYDVIVPEMGSDIGPAGLGTLLDPGHPLVEGVATFDGGISFRPATGMMHAGGVVVAEWDDGRPLVSYRQDLANRRVDLGFYPPSDDVLSTYWDSTTDGGLLLGNALAWATGQAIVDVRVELLALATPSSVDVTADPSALPGQLDGCLNSFVVEIWTSDVGALNTGITGLYVDLAYDNGVLQVTALQHGDLFPLLREGTIDNPGGAVLNFGGAEFTGQGISPDWVRLGYVTMSTVGEAPTTIAATLGSAGIGVFGRPPPPLSQIGFGSASCSEAQSCTTFADCADLDLDGVRDDACAWYDCVGGTCVAINRDAGQADVGGFAGACPIDGACDINDKFHAQNCFANLDTQSEPGYPCEAMPPSALNVDAVGFAGSCLLDGVCDINDAFAADNCFGNQDTNGNPGFPCTCSGPAPGGPSRSQRPEPVAWAELSVRGPGTAEPGSLVAIEVVLDTPLAALRGYQLHLAATGGRGAALELVDIVIDVTRRDYVYAHSPAEPWTAVNRATAQMLAGIDAPGIATPPNACLATFVYRVPRRARGTYVIDVLFDPISARPEARTFLFETPYHPVGVSSVSPAVLMIR